MFNNRLSFTFEYYSRKTSDLIMNRPLFPSSGYDTVTENVGEMKNSGVEFTISGTPINTRNFRWDITLLGAHNTNKITKLYGGLDNLAPSNVFIQKVGYARYAFYIVKHAGVDPDTGKQLYYMKENGEQITTDSYAKANAARDDDNLVGKREPDIQGSFTNSFTLFRNLDISFMFVYSLGGKVFDSGYMNLMETRNAGTTYHKDFYEKRWKKPGDITDVPSSASVPIYQTDYYLTNASYLSFKNFSIGYTFSGEKLKKAGVGSIRLVATGNNIHTWSHRKGMDPQYDFYGQTNYTYAPSRSYTLGLELNF